MTINRPSLKNWRTLAILLAVVLPSAGLACSPALPMIPWQAPMPQPRHWQTRPCSADWQAQAGEFGRVFCYRLPAGTSATRVAQDAWQTTSDQLLSRQLGPRHLRLTRTFGSEEVLDIHDKGRAGVFVNFVQRGSPQEHVQWQLRQVVQRAEASGVQVTPRHPWLRWLLGDERPDCHEFAPLDSRFVADCRVEWWPMRSEDMTGGGSEKKTAPFLVFRLRPNASLPAEWRTDRPYGAYSGGWASCGEIRVLGLKTQDYADIWAL